MNSVSHLQAQTLLQTMIDIFGDRVESEGDELKAKAYATEAHEFLGVPDVNEIDEWVVTLQAKPDVSYNDALKLLRYSLKACDLDEDSLYLKIDSYPLFNKEGVILTIAKKYPHIDS